MDAAHKKYTITHVEWEHLKWSSLTLCDTDAYHTARTWCSTNHIPFVIDEVLGCFMFTTAFTYQRALQHDGSVAYPDFIVAGKVIGAAVLIRTE